MIWIKARRTLPPDHPAPYRDYKPKRLEDAGMTDGNIAYLALIVAGFVALMVTLAWAVSANR